MNNVELPDYVSRVEKDEKFCFDCHPGVPCFTNCCRELELALTPYDVLRLRRATKLHSKEVINRYIIIEQTCSDVFPRLYLTMVDDGNTSCVFVSPEGCTIYENRPGACRAYPTGRGAIRNNQGQIEDIFVLLKEDHCKGFSEQKSQTAPEYISDQGLEVYNHFNDKVAALLQHEQVRNGKTFTKTAINHFTLALYDIDTFRERLIACNLPDTPPLTEEQKELFARDDEALLSFGIEWATKRLFGQE